MGDTQKTYDLSDVLISNNGQALWHLEQAVQGVQIFGGIGSGKTSGSGAFLADKYLRAGYGGLVLTAKTDETDTWMTYCKAAGREADLIILGPDQPARFNFLDYEANHGGRGAGLTDNIVKTLKTVIQAAEIGKQQSADDPFWESALDLHLFNTIDLCLLGHGRLDIDLLYAVYQSTPKAPENLQDKKWGEDNAFLQAFNAARHKYEKGDLTAAQQRLFQHCDTYFFQEYINLHEKTRSIIEFSLGGLLFRLTRDPIYTLLCAESSSFIPEDCFTDGKIILIDLPVKEYDKIGRDAQILFKYIWQRAMERRTDIDDQSRPVFLWADEAQNFLHEHDIDYQATARSSRVCTVYLSQNLPNYYIKLGGRNGEWTTKSFLGTMGSKIFHANADVETNKYAAELIGRMIRQKRGESRTVGEGISIAKSVQEDRDDILPPRAFSLLKSGGFRHQGVVEGILHCQSMIWKNTKGEGFNHAGITFTQKSFEHGRKS